MIVNTFGGIVTAVEDDVVDYGYGSPFHFNNDCNSKTSEADSEFLFARNSCDNSILFSLEIKDKNFSSVSFSCLRDMFSRLNFVYSSARFLHLIASSKVLYCGLGSQYAQ